MATMTTPPAALAEEERAIAEKKRLALSYLTEAWEEAASAGVDSEILAHAALFRALSDLIDTYGEQAVAGLAKSLPGRIEAFEFSPHRIVQ